MFSHHLLTDKRKSLLRWLFLSILLVLIAFTFDIPALLKVLSNTDLLMLLAAVGLASIHPLVTTLRWKQLNSAFKNPVTFSSCLIVNVYGSFIQNFTPGGVGLDGLRIAMNGALPRWGVAFLTLLDKAILAWITLLLFVISGAGLSFGSTAAIAFVALLLTALVGVIVFSKMTRWVWLDRRLSKIGVSVIGSGAMVMTCLWGMVTVLNFSLVVSVILRAVGGPVEAAVSLGYPLSILISSLPISPGGFGVREWSSVISLQARTSMEGEAIVAISLLFGVVFLIGTATGALTLLLVNARKSPV